MSLAGTDYCKENNYDPEDPRCIRVMITGKFVKVDPESDEYKLGFDNLLERHPQMKYWPASKFAIIIKIANL